MTTETSVLAGTKPVGLPDVVSDPEDGSPVSAIISAMISEPTMPDALTISSRDMGKLTTEFCSYDGSSYQGLEILKNAAKLLGPSSSGPYGGTQENPEKPSEVSDIRKSEVAQFFNNFILLANEPKRDWCKGGVSSSGWPYRGSSTNAPAYTLNKGLWAMTKVFPWQDSDTFSFCEVHNNHLQTTREELPDEVRVMIERQADVYGFKDFDESTKTSFYSRLDACVDTMRGMEEYVNYGGKRRDLKDFCVDTMKMVSPGDKADDKPAGGFSGWGKNTEEAEKTPVKRLEALLNERLLDIPWNRWIYREAFCKEATTTWSHKAVGIMVDAIAVLIPIITWGGRFLIVVLAEKTLIRAGKGIGSLVDKTVAGWKKLRGEVKKQSAAEAETAALVEAGKFDLSRLDGGPPLSVKDVMAASKLAGFGPADTSPEAQKAREAAGRVARALREFEAVNRARIEAMEAAKKVEKR